MANEPFKLKAHSGWASLPRQTKLAAVLYPDLVSDGRIRAELQSLSRLEGKKSPLDAMLKGKPVAPKKDPFKLRGK